MYKVLLLALLIASATGCDKFDNPNRPDANEFFKTPETLALAKAVEDGKIEKVKQLAANLDINTVGHRGMTFLMWAWANLEIDSFKTLLQLGADPNVVVEGRTPLSSAIRMPETDWVQALVEAGVDVNEKLGNRPTWMGLIYGENWHNLDYLLDHGIDIHADDGTGATAIFPLAGFGHYEQVMKLIERGADVTIETEAGLRFAYRVQTSLPRGDNAETEMRYRDEVVRILKSKGIFFPVPNPRRVRAMRRETQ